MFPSWLVGVVIRPGWTGASLYKRLMSGRGSHPPPHSCLFCSTFLADPGFLSMQCRIPVLYQSQVTSFASLWEILNANEPKDPSYLFLVLFSKSLSVRSIT